MGIKGAAALPTPLQIRLIALGKGHLRPKKQRNEPRPWAILIQGFQCLQQQGVSRGVTVRGKGQGFKKTHAVADHAELFEVALQNPETVDERTFLKTEIVLPPLADPKMNQTQMVQATAKPFAAAAPAKGESGQQAVGG